MKNPRYYVVVEHISNDGSKRQKTGVEVIPDGKININEVSMQVREKFGSKESVIVFFKKLEKDEVFE